MADNRYIKMKVCGNPDSNAGFMPIALFNSPTFDIADSVPGGFAENSYFFSVTIAHAQTVYKLYKNNVKSFGAMRAGTLIIGFSIPQGNVLSGGVSPMDVLLALKDTFLSQCMTCADTASETYEFKEDIAADGVLDGIARQYPLELMPGVHRTMTPGAPLAYFTAGEELTRQFMKDVQYEEFRPFSEVIIAEKASSDTDCTPLTNIQIPRPKNYRVIMEGQVRGIVGNLQQPINCSSNKNTKYYDNDSVCFTIEQLLGGETFNGVTLDAINECIVIDPSKLARPKTVQVSLSFLNNEHGQYFAQNANMLTMKVGGNVKQLAEDFSFSLVGDEIELLNNHSNFSIACNAASTYRITSIKMVGNTLAVATAPAVSTTLGGGIRQQQPQEKCIDILFSFTDTKKFPAGTKFLNIVVKGKEKNAMPVYQQVVEFTQQWNNGGTVYQGNMKMPKNKLYGFNYASFTVGKNTYTTLNNLPVGTDSIVLRDRDFTDNSKTKNLKIILIAVAAAVVLFLAGIVIYGNFFSGNDKPEKDEPGRQQQEEQHVPLNEEQVKSILEPIPTGWDSDTLSMGYVERIHRLYVENEGLFNKVDTTVFKEKPRCPVVRDYHKLLEFVNDAKAQDLKATYRSLKVYNKHKAILKELLENEIPEGRIKVGMNSVANNNSYVTVLNMLIAMKEKAFGEVSEGELSDSFDEGQRRPERSAKENRAADNQTSNPKAKDSKEKKESAQPKSNGNKQTKTPTDGDIGER